MPSPFPSTDSVETDPCLWAFLKARSQAEAEGELHRLLEAATPLIRSVLGRRRGDAFFADLEDTISEARTRLVVRLARLREEHARGGAWAGDHRETTIADFDAYVVTVARMAAAQVNRRRHPARAMLRNRLRYLLEGRTNQLGFAVWTGQNGETWAGFEAWQDRPCAPVPAGERFGRLLADARAVVPEILGEDGTGLSLPLAELVSRLFSWLDEPLRLQDLTEVVAEWQGIQPGRGEPLGFDGNDEPAEKLPPSREPSPHDELRWKEYLQWLLQEASRLTLRQRSAFLLHSSCLREMELLGLTGVRQTAALLEIPPEQMAIHWANLPLEDRVIGLILGAATQQVINLRKVARGILGRAWQRYLQEN